MRGHGEKLSRKQEALISALLLAPTLAEAAQAAGIHEATAWRWLRYRRSMSNAQPVVCSEYARVAWSLRSTRRRW